MSVYTSSMFRGCLVVVIVLLLLTAFCLANVEPGSGPYYLCLYSLIIDVPFCVFLVTKLVLEYRKRKKAAQQETKQSPAGEG